MNNQTIHDLDEAVRELNETIGSAVEFLTRGEDVRKLPLTIRDLDEAIQGLDKLIRENPDDPTHCINRGNVSFYIRDYERAISDYSKFIQIYPNNAKAYLSRGYAHFCQREYNKAISDYSKAIKIDPVYAEVYDARSSAYKHIGESNQARKDEDKAFELGFDPLDNAKDSCFELIEDLVQFCPRNAKVYYYRGLVHEWDPNLAIADYTAAIGLDPKYAEAYHRRGSTLYYRVHEEDKAIADYNEAIQLYDAYSSGRAKVIRDRGLIYENRETIDGYSKAIADYKWAARVGSLHYYELALDVYFKRGKLYAENGDYDSAIADMSEIIELDDCISTDYDEGFRRGPEYDPDSYPSNYGSVPAGQAYNDRGVYYSKKGEYDIAIADFTEVIRIYNERVELMPESNPDFAIIYLNLGSVYHGKQNYDMAVENYDNTVRLCPNYETDFIESKFVHGGQDAVEVAITLLNGIVNTPPKNADDFYYTGVQALFSNDRLSAEYAFKIALLLGYGDQNRIEQHLANLNNRE